MLKCKSALVPSLENAVFWTLTGHGMGVSKRKSATGVRRWVYKVLYIARIIPLLSDKEALNHHPRGIYCDILQVLCLKGPLFDLDTKILQPLSCTVLHFSMPKGPILSCPIVAQESSLRANGWRLPMVSRVTKSSNDFELLVR